MEKAGIIRRSVFVAAAPRVEYSLTALGRSLELVLETLFQWSVFYGQQVAAFSNVTANREGASV
jgi:DNA-binding HxlR family transcriptional regulator